jgi:hypothetical protein
MKRRSGDMKKRGVGKNKRNICENKSVRIGDVPSLDTVGTRVYSFPHRIIVPNAATSIPNTGKTLPIADPSMKELEGCILVMVGV